MLRRERHTNVNQIMFETCADDDVTLNDEACAFDEGNDHAVEISQGYKSKTIKPSLCEGVNIDQVT